MRCPVCQNPGTVVMQRQGVPVLQNVVMHDVRQAHAHPRGTLHLAHCSSCEMVWNAAFDTDKIVYDASYHNDQSHSPAFENHLNDRIQNLVYDGVVDAKVVEVGCGQGGFLAKLCDAGNNQGTGFDPAYRGPQTQGRMRFERGLYGPHRAEVPADAIICRHVIEHVADPVALVTAVRETAGEHATVYFETPDLRWILKNRVIWDVFYEHCNYFTPKSLTAVFQRAGFGEVHVSTCFDGQYLWLRARRGAAVPTAATPSLRPLLNAYAQHEAVQVERWRSLLQTLDGPVAVWGAGAKGTTLAHLVDPAGQLIDCLIDINTAKQGGFVAGSAHPIVGPQDIVERGVKHAIVVNPVYLSEIAARCRDLDLHLHSPEAPCASPLIPKLAS